MSRPQTDFFARASLVPLSKGQQKNAIGIRSFQAKIGESPKDFDTELREASFCAFSASVADARHAETG